MPPKDLIEATQPTKKVYYVVKAFLRRYFTGNRRDPVGHTIGEAEKFRSVGEALRALERYSAAHPSTWGANNIVRVEETTGTPRRELVTSGDLSLLDGPVVIKARYSDEFVHHRAEWDNW